MTRHLVVFAKNPISGEVKTRLHARYSPVQAASIYRAFILDTVRLVDDLPEVERHIAYTPQNAAKEFKSLIPANWQLFPQQGADLGTRMNHAIQHCLHLGASSVIIIGTDIPSLPEDHITQAFQLLEQKDLVLGPSTDGGYYLIGLTGLAPQVFQDISWSTREVFSQTIEKISTLGLSLGLVPPWYDVDSPDELDFLIAHQAALSLAGTPPTMPNTRACLTGLT
jgi:rSAM/selenodomain-associated transferase 1